MKQSFIAVFSFLSVLVCLALEAPVANALQLDWNGQFWFDLNYLYNYDLDPSRPGGNYDPTMIGNGGYFVQNGGTKNATWYSMYFRLKPKATINDSLNIKSQFDLGSPIYGFLGRGAPATPDQAFNFNNNTRTGLPITAQRVWATLITDFGTFELGRAPIHWGLGVIWNSGDNLFDRYQDTGDLIRWTTKFGNFWFMPSVNKISVGNNLGGASDATGTVTAGDDDVTDYSLEGKYDNSEEDFQLGFKWVRRTAQTAQRTILYNPAAPAVGSTRLNYDTFDLYFKKKWGHWTFGGELPYFTGNLGALDGANEFQYRSIALAMEVNYTSDLWDVILKMGHAPGQPSGDTADTTFRAAYFNQDYKLGLIMFNYNVYGMYNNNPDTTGSGSLNSPYNNPIVNANYLFLSPRYKLDKWTFKLNYVTALADQTANYNSRSPGNQRFYNHYTRQFYVSTDNQKNDMGHEVDLGVQFQWDENFLIAGDTGLWFPGGFYSFVNTPGDRPNNTSFLWATQIRAGITF